MFKKDCSPGPGYFIDATISRTGRDGTPMYSILGRQKDPSKISTIDMNIEIFLNPALNVITIAYRSFGFSHDIHEHEK